MLILKGTETTKANPNIGGWLLCSKSGGRIAKRDSKKIQE